MSIKNAYEIIGRSVSTGKVSRTFSCLIDIQLQKKRLKRALPPKTVSALKHYPTTSTNHLIYSSIHLETLNLNHPQ